MTTRTLLISTLISTVLLAIPVAGCAQKESTPAPEASAPSSATSAPSTAPVAGNTNTCAPQGGNQIKINGDGITCDQAYAVAAKYDLQGEKYQKIDTDGTWTCYSGTVESRPLIFQCVSGQATEFAVYPAP